MDPLDPRAENMRRRAFPLVCFWIAKSLIVLRAFLTLLLNKKTINSNR
jgi:hypothetical protein